MLKRMAIVPFEMAIAFYAVVAGIAGVMHLGLVDPLAKLLPGWETDAFNWATILAGLFMMIGVAAGRERIEQAGLLLLDGILIGRFILYGHFFHFNTNFFVTGFFTAALLMASVVRSIAINKRHIILRVENDKLISDLKEE